MLVRIDDRKIARGCSVSHRRLLYSGRVCV